MKPQKLLYKLNFLLTGDSGYNRSDILLIPILRAPPNSPEAIYNREIRRTRCKVERTFGILSNVWRSINRHRTLSYTPTKVARIIEACVILHNFRLMNG